MNQSLFIDDIDINNLYYPDIYKRLVINGCTILSIEGIDNMSELEFIHFKYCEFGDIDFSLLSKLSNLFYLRFVGGKLPDTVNISRIPQLKHLCFDCIRFDTLKIDNLAKIRDLALYTRIDNLIMDKVVTDNLENITLNYSVKLPRLPNLNSLSYYSTIHYWNSSHTLDINFYKLEHSSRFAFANYKGRLANIKLNSYLRNKALSLWFVFFYEKRDSDNCNRFSYFSF